MARRKGERTARNNERQFPNIVELPMPSGGFGSRLDAMHDFHSERGLGSLRGQLQRRDDQEFVRWCFAESGDAEAFLQQFGGRLIDP